MKNFHVFRGAKNGLRCVLKRIILFCFNLSFFGMDNAISHHARIFLLKAIGVQTKSTPRIGESLYLMSGRNLQIGHNCIIGHFLKVFDWSSIVIGDNLLASNNLTIVSATHDPITYDPIPGKISIGDNVWIGINVTIIGPVKIGNNSVIGAGALVIHDIPDNAIFAGIPARLIRYK